jgi:hypothetical protein
MQNFTRNSRQSSDAKTWTLDQTGPSLQYLSKRERNTIRPLRDQAQLKP